MWVTATALTGVISSGFSAATGASTGELVAVSIGAVIGTRTVVFTYDAPVSSWLIMSNNPVSGGGGMTIREMPEGVDADVLKRIAELTDGDTWVLADFLAERVAFAEAAGIPRSRIALDPGIGFGKRMPQNLELIERLPLLAGLGCPVLVGASRKRFIGELSGVDRAEDRVAGSVAAAIAAAQRGAAILRVHDVAETVQALAVLAACQAGEVPSVDAGPAEE